MPHTLRYIQEDSCSVALISALYPAQQGDPDGQFNMGFLWERGCGVPRHYRNAYDWYILAAYGGDTRAMIEIGDMHQLGLGVELDGNKAAEWYSLAARRGDQSAGAKLLAMGRPVPRPDLVVIPTTTQQPQQTQRTTTKSHWFSDFAKTLLLGAALYYGSQPATTPTVRFKTNCHVSSYGGYANINCY